MPTPATPGAPGPRDVFAEALSFTLRWEGGYVDDIADRGGATNRGVTQAVYDAYRRSVGVPRRSVRGITDDEVRAIYRERYWIAAKCHQLPAGIAIAHFDFAVNSGVARAVRYLQDLVGVEPDGKIGPVTLAAVTAAVERNPRLVARYIDEREDFLRRIARGSQVRFLAGWINRITDLRRFVAEHP